MSRAVLKDRASPAVAVFALSIVYSVQLVRYERCTTLADNRMIAKSSYRMIVTTTSLDQYCLMFCNCCSIAKLPRLVMSVAIVAHLAEFESFSALLVLTLVVSYLS